MKRKSVIVIPFNLPWEWSTDYTNQTAYVLSRKNTVICYMWCEFLSVKEYIEKKKMPVLIKKRSENIYLFYPILIIPFRRFPFIVKLNEKINIMLLKLFINILNISRDFGRRILWVFDPRTETLVRYFKKNWTVLYDCVDFFSGSPDAREYSFVVENEKRLAREADYVFANSKVLKEHLKKIRKDVKLVPQGFRADSFENANYDNPPVLKRGKRPIIGFVGAVNHRLDYPLIYTLFSKHKEWDFVLWGPMLEKERMNPEQKKYFTKLTKLRNVIFGQSDKSQIPGIVKQFDVGMIPYDITDDFNKYCYPMKIFEFFYLGKPVISTEIVELKRFPDLVKIASSAHTWGNIINGFLKKPISVKTIRKEKELAIENSWENKVGQILSHLQ